MQTVTIDNFYKETGAIIPEGMHKEIGHFNVFKIAELHDTLRKKPGQGMPYNRRAYYKISLIRGRNKAEYADKVIDIETSALLFATPKIPYHYNPLDENQQGYFCIFTADFLSQAKSGISLDALPIYQPGGLPVFMLNEEAIEDLDYIFKKMYREINSDYAYKYDLLRNYVLELIHYGQKLQPATALHPAHTASARISSLFIELLERQFPIESPNQTIGLRSAKEFADRLAVHVNHLNKVLKEQVGKTTTELISSRIMQEASILLKQTNWNISEIAYSLGFEEVAHFSNFFSKHAAVSPVSFRA